MKGGEFTSGHFEIKVDGADMSPAQVAALECVTVDDEIDLPAMFVFRFHMNDPSGGGLEGIDLEMFKPGNEVEVSMGHDDMQTLMTGEVTALEPHFGKVPYIDVRGYDKMHRLRFGTYRRSFEEMTDSDIAGAVAGDAGLSPETDDSVVVHPYVFQNNQTNYEFILERARKIGFEILGQDGKLFFRKPKISEGPAATLTYRDGLVEMDLQLQVLAEGSAVETRGWDIMTKEAIEYTTPPDSEDSKMGGSDSGYVVSEEISASPVALIQYPLLDADEAEQVALGVYNANLNGFITGEGRAFGDAAIRSGKTVKLEGLGPKFTGDYYVVASSHTCSPDGYETTFKVRKTGI